MQGNPCVVLFFGGVVSWVNNPYRVVDVVAREDLEENQKDTWLARCAAIEAALGITVHRDFFDVVLAEDVPTVRTDEMALKCDLCGNVYGRSKMIALNGRHYCTVNECSRTMNDEASRRQG